jgi:hypothetical protein
MKRSRANFRIRSPAISSDVEKLGVSKLASYIGRGSLESWLKAVLAHAYVDRHRAERHVLRLDERLAAIGMACLSGPAVQDLTAQYAAEGDRMTRLHLALEEAFAQRTPEQRFVLAAHFFDGWTLAEIANQLGVRIHRQPAPGSSAPNVAQRCYPESAQAGHEPTTN